MNSDYVVLQKKFNLKKMAWRSIIIACKKNAKSFSASDEYEIDIIADTVKKIYWFLTEHEIREAVALCCMQIVPPRKPEIFMECLRVKLNLL